MYKVVVIDDELIVRKGLINIINWETLGCKIVGEAGNGIDGLKIIEEKEPDILITDINMPEVDGLEMIRNIKVTLPNIKIIVLTGYRDFDYIQEALKLGASEFLLKPSKISEIDKALRNICLELKFSKVSEERVIQLEEHFQKTLPLLKEKLLFEILYSPGLNADAIEDELKLYNTAIDEFVIVVIETAHKNEIDVYQRRLQNIGITNGFLDCLNEDYKCDSVNISQLRIGFIIQKKDENPLSITEIFHKIEKFQVIFNSCYEQELIISISSSGKGWNQLYNKMKECEEAFRYFPYFGENAVILYDDIKNLSLNMNDVNIGEIKNNIVASINAGNIKFVSELNVRLYETLKDVDNYEQFYEELLEEIVDKKNDSNDYFSDVKDIESYHQKFEAVALKYIDINKEAHRKNISKILQQSLEYIHNNYQESISLNDVADYTFVSTCYLSRMFKKEIGKNFVDYLNEYRIEKAKVYLKDFELKGYEVAELVGIPDPHYFSKIFKKYVGETPTTYKNR